MGNIDLLSTFLTFRSCTEVFEKVIEALKDADPAVAVLALEGLFCIEEKVNSKQFPGVPESQVKNILRKWRCESPLSWGYETDRAPKFLKGLTIFKTLQVPLFIDNYGYKQLLSSFKPEEKMNVRIDGETPIFHVTHQEEAERIASEGKFQPSDNKNIIKGTWFGLDNPTDSSSVYGSNCFETTLSKLGVEGLHQGEVVSYKYEVNVILYAADDDGCNWNGLKKPADEAVNKINEGAYVKVSIFVPARFLNVISDKFHEVVSGPTKVDHGPFCVREKRSDYQCKELGKHT